MKATLLRFGVLVSLIVLGWITMAHAQRDDSNPLREPPPVETAAPPRTEPVSHPPAADPFGNRSQNVRAAGALAATNAQPPDSIPDAPAARMLPPPTGPALTSSDGTQTVESRYTTRSANRDRAAAPAGGRYSSPPTTSASPAPSAFTSPTSEAREPAPFRADPSATPASSSRTPNTDRNAFTAPPSSESNNASDFSGEGQGTGQPGDARLDGVQSPQISIQKIAPKEIQVGKPAAFRITVRNTGSVTAGEVEIHDQIPKGTRLLGTTPQATRDARGGIVWPLGTLRPGEEAKVEMQVMPMAEGEIGSVATVRFAADASARTIATRPQLVVEATVAKKAMIGDPVTVSIVISNPGTGVATGVVLEEHIPAGLKHPAGSELEYKVGDLKPGESRKLDLPLVASQAGVATNVLSAHGDGNLRAEHRCDFEVVAPQLDVAVEGPKRRYLERQATYQFSVSNPGTAAAKHIELVAQLPPGLKFVKANNAGYYEEATRTVRWQLEELPANETGSVELVTLPIEAGQHAMRLRGTAQKGLVAEKEQPVLVEGIAAILFQVADAADPIEIGGETTYEVRVVNQGSKAAGNVRLTVDLPPELKPLAAEGPTRFSMSENRVVFEGLAQLAPKAESTFRVRVKALHPGDLRARFQLLSDDMQTPVTKEESTRVYADE